MVNAIMQWLIIICAFGIGSSDQGLNRNIFAILWARLQEPFCYNPIAWVRFVM